MCFGLSRAAQLTSDSKTSIWAGALTGAINPSSGTVWGPEVIAPSTSWSETLEQFKFWNDGNSFWQDVNAKYEDL